MIKRVIGTLAVLASLAVMVLTVLHRNEYSSMVVIDEPAVPATDDTSAAPAVEEPNEPSVPEGSDCDSVRTAV